MIRTSLFFILCLLLSACGFESRKEAQAREEARLSKMWADRGISREDSITLTAFGYVVDEYASYQEKFVFEPKLDSFTVQISELRLSVDSLSPDLVARKNGWLIFAPGSYLSEAARIETGFNYPAVSLKPSGAIVADGWLFEVRSNGPYRLGVMSPLEQKESNHWCNCMKFDKGDEHVSQILSSTRRAIDRLKRST